MSLDITATICPLRPSWLRLEKGKDCSPDDENGACCSKDGFFKSFGCTFNMMNSGI